ncbi:MAG TPA: serine/threonine-protein kinase, partial [bacterium]|nr:serine/threonine-protein kinase [bacterium]
MIGQTISHYTILEKIGEGGMGEVYKALDTKLDRIVAVKCLPPYLNRDKEFKQRFIYEAKSASSLDHPNICTIFEIDETEDGQMFIVMGYVEGQSLQQKIKSGPIADIDEFIDIAIQIAEGLSAAHEHDIIHRDMKSDNIMIDVYGHVKIMDFGLAKVQGRTQLTNQDTTLGTIDYMSPEQAHGEQVDHRSDIWSLGVILYEMVSGQLPFKGEYAPAVIYSILSEQPEPLTGLRTGIPIELERIVNKALAKNRDERYQHVHDLIVDLRRLRKALETGDSREPSEDVTERARRQRFKRYAIPVVVLFFLAMGFILFRPFLFEEILISEPQPIAVISFENLTGDETYDYLQNAIPNLLITNLEQSKYLRVTTWERMHDLLEQMGER